MTCRWILSRDLRGLVVVARMVSCVCAGSALLVCTTAGAVAAGVPFQWLPAPLVAACGLALFFDSRNLREYIVFVVGAFMTGGGVIHTHTHTHTHT